jgi:hypothetical protein
MVRQVSDFDSEMARLEAEIRRLEAEYNMFFAGRLPRLPWETRARVEALVKRLDQMKMLSTSERFRFGTVQARFTKFCELWERSLRAKEEGRRLIRRAGSPSEPVTEPAATRTPDSATAKTSDPAPTPTSHRARLVHVAAFRNPADEIERMQSLYERLSEARKETGEAPLPYDRFAAVVRAQVNKLGGGSAEVAFQVAVKDGKVMLTAKALKE